MVLFILGKAETFEGDFIITMLGISKTSYGYRWVKKSYSATKD